MSTSDPYDEPGDDPNPTIQQMRATIKDQADKLKDLDSLKEQAEKAAILERENALFKANLGSLSEAQQKAVLATADEITETGLRSQAELLGFVQPATPAVPAEDLAALERMTTTPPGGAVSEGDYEAEISGARNESEVAAIMAKYGKPGFYDTANAGADQ